MRAKCDLLSKLVVFHENVKQLEKEILSAASSLTVNVPGHTKGLFERIFQRDFVDHFKFEETIVFPAIRAWDQNETYEKVIRDYIAIHEKLLLAGNQILRRLSTIDDSFAKNELAQIITSLGELNLKACAHAKHEDSNIVPLLEGNSTIRFLSGRNMLAYKSAFESLFPE